MIDLTKKYTSNGNPVTQLIYFTGIEEDYCLFGVVDKEVESWTDMGIYSRQGIRSVYNLKEVKPEQWVNLYWEDGKSSVTGIGVYASKEEACGKAHDCFTYIKTVRVDQ